MKKSPGLNIAKLVSNASTQNDLGGIVHLLKHLAMQVDAAGCILWESEPFASLNPIAPKGNLYMFASWFRNIPNRPLQTLPIIGSANGYAMIHGKTVAVDDLKTSEMTHKSKYSIKVAKLTSVYVVPISYNSPHEFHASLSVYRQHEVKPFTKAERGFIDQAAKLIPALYKSVCDRVELKLLSKINSALDEMEKKFITPKTLATKTVPKPAVAQSAADQAHSNVNAAMTNICKGIGEAFQCIETSMFLEDRFNQEGRFKKVGTSYSPWTDFQQEYLPDKQQGLTGWVLAERKPIRIFDLSKFAENREQVSIEYRGVTWNDSLEFGKEPFERKMRTLLKLESDSELPPFSFMAVPIIRGEDLLGVIRCCTARRPPWFFPDRHIKVLEAVAVHIGRFWNDFLTHLEERKEASSWKALVEDINKLNDTVQKHTERLDLKKGATFDAILELAERHIEGADILDIRISHGQNLRFERTRGDAWKEGGETPFQRRKNKKFPIRSRKHLEKNLGVEVFLSSQIKCINDLSTLVGYEPNTFPGIRKIIVAPIGVQNKTEGVLTIRGRSAKPFTDNAVAMAELLGRQLGLYLSLWKGEEQQRQVFEDLWHQLKIPIRYISARMESSIASLLPYRTGEFAEIDEIRHNLRILKGITRKASRVTENAGVFTDLAKHEKLKVVPGDLRRLTRLDAFLTFLEVGIDTGYTIEDYRNIRFDVDRDSFSSLNRLYVRVNPAFLEQAASCLLDNAGKYSYPDTVVFTHAGLTTEPEGGSERFFVAVRNEGIELRFDETHKVITRGYRGTLAKYVTGEGSGIGLWVVSHLMQAQGGELQVFPTKIAGWTEVRLVFPIVRVDPK
ncbi:MAG: GAF domain-containing protein [Pyrinomonadaceae bacterium]